MRVIQNNAHRPQAERFVWCTVCTSKLAITDADMERVQGKNMVACPCCNTYFPVMTEAEVTAAYYQK